MTDFDTQTYIKDLKITLNLGTDGIWTELLSQEDANLAERLTKTAISRFYAMEFKAEEGHPRRWFMLVEEGSGKPVGSVCLAVTPEGADIKNPSLLPLGVHTTGFQNRPPYPDYADQIQALSDAVGIEIQPNYMGRPVEVPSRGPSM